MAAIAGDSSVVDMFDDASDVPETMSDGGVECGSVCGDGDGLVCGG